MDTPETVTKSKGGRKFSANPKVTRVTILVTPAAREAWQAAANKEFDSNISTMIRQFVNKSLAAQINS